MTGSPRSRSELLKVLRAHKAELQARGVETITLFGSLARDDATSTSDVDLAIRPGAGFSSGGFDHFGRLEALRDRLVALLGCDVDLVEEPVAGRRLKQAIAEEGVRAFYPARHPLSGHPRQHPADRKLPPRHGSRSF